MIKRIILSIGILMSLCGFAYAGCSDMSGALCNKTFSTVISDITFEVEFSDSAFGPCPSGWADITYPGGYIGAPYRADPDNTVDIDGIGTFLLYDGKLILITEDAIILDPVE
jgi:hypothetical protein